MFFKEKTTEFNLRPITRTLTAENLKRSLHMVLPETSSAVYSGKSVILKIIAVGIPRSNFYLELFGISCYNNNLQVNLRG